MSQQISEEKKTEQFDVLSIDNLYDPHWPNHQIIFQGVKDGGFPNEAQIKVFNTEFKERLIESYFAPGSICELEKNEWEKEMIKNILEISNLFLAVNGLPKIPLQENMIHVVSLSMMKKIIKPYDRHASHYCPYDAFLRGHRIYLLRHQATFWEKYFFNNMLTGMLIPLLGYFNVDIYTNGEYSEQQGWQTELGEIRSHVFANNGIKGLIAHTILNRYALLHGSEYTSNSYLFRGESLASAFIVFLIQQKAKGDSALAADIFSKLVKSYGEGSLDWLDFLEIANGDGRLIEGFDIKDETLDLKIFEKWPDFQDFQICWKHFIPDPPKTF